LWAKIPFGDAQPRDLLAEVDTARQQIEEMVEAGDTRGDLEDTRQPAGSVAADIDRLSIASSRWPTDQRRSLTCQPVSLQRRRR
jgi:hypothetical protein